MKELISALIAAKANFAPIVKDLKNPQFKGKKYASLDAVFSAIDQALAEQGLTVTQPTDVINGRPVLITHLWHISGECLSGTYLLPTTVNTTEKTTNTIVQIKDDYGATTPMNVDTKTTSSTNDEPQKLAAGITYARRYALCSLLGITAEGDDEGDTRPQTQRSVHQAQKPKPTTPNQADRVKAAREKQQLTKQAVLDLLAVNFNGKHPNELSPAECDRLIELIEAQAAINRKPPAPITR